VPGTEAIDAITRLEKLTGSRARGDRK
jgi:hypothetical protein